MIKKQTYIKYSFTLLFLPLYSHAMFSTAARSFAAVGTRSSISTLSPKAVGSLLTATRYTTSNSFIPDTTNQQSNLILPKFYSTEKIAKINNKIEYQKIKAEMCEYISEESGEVYCKILEGSAILGLFCAVPCGIIATCSTGNPLVGATVFIGYVIGVPGVTAITTSPLAIISYLTFCAEGRANEKISQLEKAIQDELLTKPKNLHSTLEQEIISATQEPSFEKAKKD